MKLIGDYSLFFYESPNSEAKPVAAGRYSAIEITKSAGGTVGGKPLKVYELKCKSVHGEYYDKRIGMVFRFLLRNNADGISTKYEVGKKPLQFPIA